MSVQAGVWNFDGRPVDRRVLGKVAAETVRYGPDGEQIYISDSIGILYRPLYTTPESCFERQPLVFSNERVLTWDGRLDNREELISRLGQPLSLSSTDVEIVATAYERWHSGCLAYLLGDWALAIWSPKERELLLARDYVGSRPLFHYLRAGQLSWSSHLEALLQLNGDLSLCEEFIAGYLTFQPDAHLTPFRGIEAVPPGGFVQITSGRISHQKYWDFSGNRGEDYKTDAEYEEQFRTLFAQAVRRRLRSSTPILAELSGGLDSSAVVCMADSLCAENAGYIKSVDTFSFFDLAEPDEEDVLFFPIVEQFRGKAGYRAELKATGDSFTLTPTNFSAVPGSGVRPELSAAKMNVVNHGGYRVILSGNGGDQLLGEGLDPRIMLADSLVRLRFREFGKRLIDLSLATRRPAIQLALDGVVHALPTSLRELGCKTTMPWINTAFARKYRVEARLLAGALGPWNWLPSAREKVQMLSRLRGERTHTPPSSVEVRYPFLDRQLFEFVLAVPVSQLFRHGQRRSLARRALSGVVPKEVLSRHTKSGTGRCTILTISKHWEEIVSVVDSSFGAEVGILNKNGLIDAMCSLRKGRVPDRIGQFLRALSFEFWLRDMASRRVVSIGND
ncbi:MAG TPA: asparagine synthase-related protein [Candidatus Angelobacter sp.]|jgi:asparagine synthase (glutamine-hydrolysing)